MRAHSFRAMHFVVLTALSACADHALTSPVPLPTLGIAASNGGPPPEMSVVATNKNGQSVGWIGPETKVAFWSAATGLLTINPFEALPAYPGGTLSQADLRLFINNRGIVYGSDYIAVNSQIVGYSYLFLWVPGKSLRAFGTGWADTYACCINDRGTYVYNLASKGNGTVGVASISDAKSVSAEFDLRALLPNMNGALAGVRADGIDESNTVSGVALLYVNRDEHIFPDAPWTWNSERGMRLTGRKIYPPKSP